MRRRRNEFQREIRPWSRESIAVPIQRQQETQWNRNQADQKPRYPFVFDEHCQLYGTPSADQILEAAPANWTALIVQRLPILIYCLDHSVGGIRQCARPPVSDCKQVAVCHRRAPASGRFPKVHGTSLGCNSCLGVQSGPRSHLTSYDFSGDFGSFRRLERCSAK